MTVNKSLFTVKPTQIISKLTDWLLPSTRPVGVVNQASYTYLGLYISNRQGFGTKVCLTWGYLSIYCFADSGLLGTYVGNRRMLDDMWQYIIRYGLMCCILYQLRIVEIHPYQGMRKLVMMPSIECVAAIHTSIAPFLFQTALSTLIALAFASTISVKRLRFAHIPDVNQAKRSGVAAATHLCRTYLWPFLSLSSNKFYNFSLGGLRFKLILNSLLLLPVTFYWLAIGPRWLQTCLAIQSGWSWLRGKSSSWYR